MIKKIIIPTVVFLILGCSVSSGVNRIVDIGGGVTLRVGENWTSDNPIEGMALNYRPQGADGVLASVLISHRDISMPTAYQETLKSFRDDEWILDDDFTSERGLDAKMVAIKLAGVTSRWGSPLVITGYLYEAGMDRSKELIFFASLETYNQIKTELDGIAKSLRISGDE